MADRFPVNTLEKYLPHRPPMVWVDEITSVHGDYTNISGTCEIRVRPDGLYVNNGNELRGSAAIEFTAQAFGYLKAAHQVLNNINNPPTRTYLTGVRSCESQFMGLKIEANLVLEVSLSVARQIGNLTFVKGVLRKLGDDQVLAKTEIQVYVE